MDGDEPGEGSETEKAVERNSTSKQARSDEAVGEADGERLELEDLDPNAEKQARKVERQLRRLQREMRG